MEQYPVAEPYLLHAFTQPNSRVKLDVAARVNSGTAAAIRNAMSARSLLRAKAVLMISLTSECSRDRKARSDSGAFRADGGRGCGFGGSANVSTAAMVSTEANERPSSIEIDAAAKAIKVKLLAGWEGGFRNVLRLNFPDDNIRAMAEAALVAARQSRDENQTS